MLCVEQFLPITRTRAQPFISLSKSLSNNARQPSTRVNSPKCGGVIKPDIIFYEESLNENVLNRAWEDFSRSDLCLVLGSSLTVQPAASLPMLARRNGADIVIVNAQRTPQDSSATLLFKDLKQTFEALNAYLVSR